MDDGRASAVEYGQLPAAEYPMTEQHVRTLWRFANASAENMDVRDPPAVGTLLSEQLDSEALDPRPAVLLNEGPTGQSWTVLGER
ncbi:hypothetical protein [Halalkalicoccus salilacus]